LGLPDDAREVGCVWGRRGANRRKRGTSGRNHARTRGFSPTGKEHSSGGASPGRGERKKGKKTKKKKRNSKRRAQVSGFSLNSRQRGQRHTMKGGGGTKTVGESDDNVSEKKKELNGAVTGSQKPSEKKGAVEKGEELGGEYSLPPGKGKKGGFGGSDLHQTDSGGDKRGGAAPARGGGWCRSGSRITGAKGKTDC